MYKNIEFKKIYKIFYISNNKKFFAFAKKNRTDFFTDIITNKIISIKDIYLIIYNDIKNNCKIIKYYKHLYKLKNNNENIFNVESYKEINNFLMLDILRFFNITEENLFDISEKNKNIFNIKEKIKKYSRRYLDSKLYNDFSNQLDYLKTIPSILSFIPYEVKQKKHFFWLNFYINNDIFRKLLYSLDMDWCKIFNKYKLDWELLFKNKKEYEIILQNKLEEIKNNSKLEFKEKIPILIKKRINDGLDTLKKEEKQAIENNDNDFLFEINIIKEFLLDLEKNFDYSLCDFAFEKELSVFWPEILLPIPEKEKDFEYYKDYLIFKELLNWIYVRNTD
jgi:hypothetical protein